MPHHYALLNVIDVEATCWDGLPPPGTVHEIIEIGLTVVDLSAARRVSRHRLLVRPVRSTVSAFCTELTGLTQAEVDLGVSFAEACRILVDEHGAGERPWASWGEYDRRQFARQSQADGVGYPFGYPAERSHTNAKAVFAEAYGLRRKPGMAQALQLAGLPLEGRHHRGEDDAWNIAALVLDLRSRGDWPPSGGPSAANQQTPQQN
ncbi:DNA polymerase III [Streptomyces tateyamensis]|uniref:DNA polymerase III n=1 Tax=Streptomyces tateyamensis TaxID=565073 RepID=A0A2V4NQX6_9ACTN|nr:3'-5' exonuclease [Streptomyces tateyamensis]PYC88282.1 DNA polymerase III [Streptomyces tateyamensis]